MEESIKVNGLTITWKELVYTHGQMVGSMRANTKMIRNMDLAFIPGLTRGSIKDCGSKGSSMD
jgi:hypothetical protein